MPSASFSTVSALPAPAPSALWHPVSRGRSAGAPRRCRVACRAEAEDASSRRSTSPVAVRRPVAARQAVPGPSDHPRSVSAKASKRAGASIAAAASVLLAPVAPTRPAALRKAELPRGVTEVPRNRPDRASAASAAYLAMAPRRPAAADTVGGRRVRNPSKGRSGPPQQDAPPRVGCVQGPLPQQKAEAEVQPGSVWGLPSMAQLNNIEPINDRIRAVVQPARVSEPVEMGDDHQVERDLLERSWSARTASVSGAPSSPSPSTTCTSSRQRISSTAARKPAGPAFKVSRARRCGRVVRGSRAPALQVEPLRARPQPQVPNETEHYVPADLLGAQAQLQALKRRCERDVGRVSTNEDGVAELLASGPNKLLLSKAEETSLIELIIRQKRLDTIAAELTAAGSQEPSDEMVAETAELAGGVHELLLVRALAIQARELMVSCNLRLVVAMARKQHNVRGMHFKDFIFEGIKGLHRAIDKFDTSKNVKFSTYAHWWVYQAITRSISNESRVVRLPAHAHDIIGKINKTEAKLFAETDGAYSLSDVAEVVGLSPEKIEMYKKLASEPQSMESPVSADSESQLLMDTLCQDDDPEGLHSSSAILREQQEEEAAVGQEFVATAINGLLQVLHPRERNIIRMRYGLHSSDGSSMTFAEIGQSYGVTQERIRQIEAGAMRKLRRYESVLQKSLNPL